ncbi:AMP-binding protein [Nocardia flavorosea]|uniref:AMP-binding protein n=1 Tax=Nocardia flavorosea TaxID=53429 RepID=A0A846YS39_9NOCA|nr:AMP-binding protein [Nocardia flavorosea]NKY60501.1 AMP-binding protein [Nocardia flavorosea]
MQRVTIGDVIREHRRSYPDKTAVVDGDLRLTWPEFDDRVNRLAHALAAQGVANGHRVLWLGQTSARVFELLGACAKLGAMVCPVNWRMSAHEMAFVIDDFTPTVVIWQDEEIGEVVRAAREISDGGAVWWQHDLPGADNVDTVLAAQPATDIWGPVDADLPLLVIYTAAIDGHPNGSMITQHNLVCMGIESSYLNSTTSNSVFLNSGPLFHIGNFQWEAMAAFVQGATNVFVRRADADELLDIVTKEKVTAAFLMPPTIIQMKEKYDPARHDLTSLKAGVYGQLWGEGLVGSEQALWGLFPGGFGQTEVTGLAIFNGHGGHGTGNSGRPGPFSRVRILDDDWNELGVGEVGEIAIGGEIVHAGYWNRPETNARRMRDGWWRTTDLGRREADGTIEFVGTSTRMIKSAAENIFPKEVEVCLEAHPAVREAALIGTPDERFVQSVLAVVVLEPGATVTEDELITHCKQRIASYKKPKSVVFVDEIPRNGEDKDYSALDERFGGGGYPGGDVIRV